MSPFSSVTFAAESLPIVELLSDYVWAAQVIDANSADPDPLR